MEMARTVINSKDGHVNGFTINHWHIIFGGFTQRLSSNSSNGTLYLWSALHNKFAAADTAIEWYPWDADVKGIADKVHEFKSRFGESSVRIYGYSYGCTAAVRLAKALQRNGISVHRMVLCDPVYRHHFPLGNWRSLLSSQKLVVPSNVYRVDWLYQRNPRFSINRRLKRLGHVFEPAGHQVTLTSEKHTIMEYAIELELCHSQMDNAQAFHNLALTGTCHDGDGETPEGIRDCD